MCICACEQRVGKPAPKKYRAVTVTFATEQLGYCLWDGGPLLTHGCLGTVHKGCPNEFGGFGPTSPRPKSDVYWEDPRQT